MHNSNDKSHIILSIIVKTNNKVRTELTWAILRNFNKRLFILSVLQDRLYFN